MGLIPDAMESIKPACEAINITTGATMHIHGNVEYSKTSEKQNAREISCNRTLKAEWVTWADFIVDVVKQTMCSVYDDNITSRLNVDIIHIQRVKSYGPRIDHLVLDIKVSFDTAIK